MSVILLRKDQTHRDPHGRGSEEELVVGRGNFSTFGGKTHTDSVAITFNNYRYIGVLKF